LAHFRDENSKYVLVDVAVLRSKAARTISPNRAADDRPLFEGQLAASDSDHRDKMVLEIDWLRPDDPVRMREP
jgi:hypothetical protein